MVSDGPMPVFEVRNPEKPVFCLDSGQWLTGRVGWLISCEAAIGVFHRSSDLGFGLGCLLLLSQRLSGFLRFHFKLWAYGYPFRIGADMAGFRYETVRDSGGIVPNGCC